MLKEENNSLTSGRELAYRWGGYSPSRLRITPLMYARITVIFLARWKRRARVEMEVEMI